MRGVRVNRDTGQGTVEWIGLTMLVSVLLLGVLAAAGDGIPGEPLARAVAARILSVRCTASDTLRTCSIFGMCSVYLHAQRMSTVDYFGSHTSTRPNCVYFRPRYRKYTQFGRVEVWLPK